MNDSDSLNNFSINDGVINHAYTVNDEQNYFIPKVSVIKSTSNNHFKNENSANIDNTHQNDCNHNNNNNNNNKNNSINDVVEGVNINDSELDRLITETRPLSATSAEAIIGANNEDYTDENSHANVSIKKSKLIYFIDLLLSALIFGPISGFYWYGTWTFLDVYFLPNNIVLSSCICYISGLLILLPGYVLQVHLQQFHNRLTPKLQYLFRNFYIYVISFACVLEWRGCWTLLDKYLVMDWRGQLSLSIIAISYMLIARSFLYVTSIPFSLRMDTDYNEYFLLRSRYKFKSIESKYLQNSFDFVISELIESIASMIAWRGIGYTIDLFLFPNNMVLSLILTAIIGYLIYFILSFSQHYIYLKSVHLQLIPRLVIEDVIKLIMFLSIILIWRFYWILIDSYICIKSYQLEFYISFHYISFILSILLNASIVVTGPGVEFKDGELNDNFSFFHIEYLSILIQQKITVESSVRQRNRRYVMNE